MYLIITESAPETKEYDKALPGKLGCGRIDYQLILERKVSLKQMCSGRRNCTKLLNVNAQKIFVSVF